jgi:hypothetical protein
LANFGYSGFFAVCRFRKRAKKPILLLQCQDAVLPAYLQLGRYRQTLESAFSGQNRVIEQSNGLSVKKYIFEGSLRLLKKIKKIQKFFYFSVDFAADYNIKPPLQKKG